MDITFEDGHEPCAQCDSAQHGHSGTEFRFGVTVCSCCWDLISL